MNPESQRIAVAEACGQMCPHPDGIWRMPERLPDYLSDLNAIREAKKVLNQKQQALFLHHLLVLLGFDRTIPFFDQRYFASQEFADMCWELTNASAARQSEAFLRTIGKWNDQSADEKTTGAISVSSSK